MDIDRTKQQDFGRRAGGESRRDRLSAADGGDLILTQSDVLPKEGLQLRIGLRKAGMRDCGNYGQQCGRGQNSSHRGYFTFPILLHRLGRVPSSNQHGMLDCSVLRFRTEKVAFAGFHQRKIDCRRDGNKSEI